LGNTETLQDEDYIDWGHAEQFATAIGVGECAGVIIDLVSTLILEAAEKISFAEENIDKGAYADAIYQIYSGFVSTAKALLLNHSIHCNTQGGILKDFDTHFTKKGLYSGNESFAELVLQINKNEPSAAFANSYLQQAKDFIQFATEFKEQAVEN